MSRWNFYKQNFLKNINKNEKFLLISASINEIQILRNLGFANFAITYHNEQEVKKSSELWF